MPWSTIPGSLVIRLLLQHSGLTGAQLRHELKLERRVQNLDLMDLLNCLWELGQSNLITIDGHDDSQVTAHAISKELMLEVGGRTFRASRHYLEVQSALGEPVTVTKSNPEPHVHRREGEITAWPVFDQPRPLPKPSDLFVVMPFLPELTPIYRDHIVPVAVTLGLSVIRADDVFTPNAVVDDVWSGIFHSCAVIADCTGRNANVFYEIGIAHCLGKDIILITQRPEDVPIDVRHIKYLQYEYTPRGMKDFEKRLRETLKSTCMNDDHLHLDESRRRRLRKEATERGVMKAPALMGGAALICPHCSATFRNIPAKDDEALRCPQCETLVEPTTDYPVTRYLGHSFYGETCSRCGSSIMFVQAFEPPCDT